jgi:hypothetical protein
VYVLIIHGLSDLTALLPLSFFPFYRTHLAHPISLASRYKMDGPAESPTLPWQPTAASEIVASPKALGRICENLEKKELLNMAVTCKAISSAALDEIWRSRRSMAQFLAPLYHDGFISDPMAKMVRNASLDSLCLLTDFAQFLLRAPDQAPAWARFCEYAERVEELTASGNFFQPIHNGSIFQLVQAIGNRPMFPNLRRLTAAFDEGESIASELPFFKSPALRCVTIQVQSYNADALVSAQLVASFLSIMKEKCVPLTHLSLIARIPVSVLPLFSVLSQSKTLRFIRLEGIRCLDDDDADWVTNLGLLDALEELKIVAERDRSNRLPVRVCGPHEVLKAKCAPDLYLSC